MFLDEVLPKIEKLASFQKLNNCLAKANPRIVVAGQGLWGTSRAFFLGLLRKTRQKPFLVITRQEEQAWEMAEDLEALIEEEGVVSWFPSWQILAYDPLPVTPEISEKRVMAMYEALSQSLSGRGKNLPILVASLEALLVRTLPPEEFLDSLLVFKKGEEIPFGDLPARLSETGYERVSQVEKRREFALRGGILDIYGPLAEIKFLSQSPEAAMQANHNESLCLRVEFEGDEVVSLRLFDVLSQQSYARLESCVVLPGSELRLKGGIGAGRQEGSAGAEAGVRFPGVENYLPRYYDKTCSLLDYLSPETILWLEEPGEMEVEEQKHNERAQRLYESAKGRGEACLAPHERYFNLGHLMEQAGRHTLVLASLLQQAHELAQPEAMVQFSVRSNEPFQGKFPLLMEELASWKQRGTEVHFLCHNEGEKQRLQELLKENDQLSPHFYFRENLLRAGFFMPEISLGLVSNQEIFGRMYQKVKRKSSPYSAKGRGLSSLAEIGKGDYLVHKEHGIAIYRGLTRLKVEGNESDYITLQYADNDKLYVPVDQLDKIRRYTGSSAPPKIYRLGGASWDQVKEKVKGSIQEMARELLELYAERSSAQGHAFAGDTPWQSEFESSFVYQETADQATATSEIKRTLEQPQPMDYLLCGDVGYGKTEVAMRAAFKVMMDKKQVAVLVPTTLLAEQHFFTFSQRFADYPVRVAMLSRFKTRAEQAKIVQELGEGKVDLVIGTHRLLQKDIVFRDLGLLIIDEEHRFGVGHKEKLKQLKTTVDVLSLTATPIPRTLHMAFSGLRPMSLIATPPLNRLPIQTFVQPYREETVREAIWREINRGGQVFYVHNRVRDIQRAKEQLQAIVPDARVCVAHGQMDEKELEQVMKAFLGRAYDVLMSTSIIESGLDIPTVNTLVIEDAENFGLAQLYQLRGRVGRSEEKAYAYLLYSPDQVIDENAKKRLRSIQEFTELGSGFRLAMRDLEIRGAGNLLGKAQHGNMQAVGFDLYCELLQEAVANLKQGAVPVIEERPEIVVPVDAYFPDDYIPDSSTKIQLYERLLQLKTLTEVDDFSLEMLDRFGAVPAEARAVLLAAKVRILCPSCGIKKVRMDEEMFSLVFSDLKTVSLKTLEKAFGQGMMKPSCCSVQPDGSLLFKKNMGLEELITLLQRLADYVSFKKP